MNNFDEYSFDDVVMLSEAVGVGNCDDDCDCPDCEGEGV